MEKIPYYQWDTFIDALDDYIRVIVNITSDSSIYSYKDKMNRREVLDEIVVNLIEIVEKKEE